jgi:ribonuclease BN (tRNA processing enzyme)
MEIIILGSGTFIPDLKRHCSSYLLKSENNLAAFDFGRGAIDGLLRARINLYNLDNIFISHMHGDHSAELISFILFIKYSHEKNRLKKVYKIYGPRGIKKKIMLMLKIFEMSKKNMERFKIIELKHGKSIHLGKLNVKCFDVKHEGHSLAFRIEEGNKVLCYSGDSSYCKNLIKACKNADIAILDSTLPEKWRVPTHMTGEEAGRLAREAGVKKLVLTHIAKFYFKYAIYDAQKHYRGPIILAKDMMKITW